MAACDTQEGGASAAGGAARDEGRGPVRVLVAAGEQYAPDDAPVAPGASDDDEEGGEAGAEDPPLRDHAPVAPGASDDDEEGGEAGAEDPPLRDHAPVAPGASDDDEEGGEAGAEDPPLRDHAPVAPGASDDDEEGGEAGAEDPPLRDHAPVVLVAAGDGEGARGAVEAGRDGVPEAGEGQGVEDGGRDEDSGVMEMDEDSGVMEMDEEGDEEDAPTHLPFAQFLADTTPVDPSYTISLIRKLIPKGSNLEKEFSDKQSDNSENGEPMRPDNKDPSEKSDYQSNNLDKVLRILGHHREEQRDSPNDLAATGSETELMDCVQMKLHIPVVGASSKSFTECLPEVGADANISINPQDKKHRPAQSHINCPSAQRKIFVRVIFLLLVMTGCTALASASQRPACEVTSLATNVRLFCTENQPSSSCCDSLRAAAMSHGRLRCLCMVGSAPDVITIGFSPENLVRLHAQCTEHDDGFSCEEADKNDRGERMPPHGRNNDIQDDGHDKGDLQEEDERYHGERMPPHGRNNEIQEDGNDESDPPEEDERYHGERMPPHGRNNEIQEDGNDESDPPEEESDERHHGPHGSYNGFDNDGYGKAEPLEEVKDERSHREPEGHDGTEYYESEEAGHPRKQQTEDLTSDAPKSHGGSTSAILVGLLVLALFLVLGVGVALTYRHRHGLNINQLVHAAAAAALAALAPQTGLAAPDDLPPPQPNPAAPAAPAMVNGVPVRQELPLAYFPGPVQIVSLLLYVLADKMRRNLRQ